MNQIDLIKRGWQMAWRFRVLWIFGILLALTTGGGGGGGGGGSGGNSVGALPGVSGMTGPAWATLAGVIILCCCVILILVAIALVVRYVAEAALYRMADSIDATGAAPTWREGFRLGWTNRTLRLFLLDLAWGIPVAIVIVLLIGLTVAPVLLFRNGSGASTLGIVLTVAIGLLSVLIGLVLAVAISLLRKFWARDVVLHDLSVGQALAGGIAEVRARLGDVALLWLIMFGIGLLFFLVMVPLVIALLLVGLAAGGGLGWGLYALTRSVALAVIVGLPVFLVIFVVPFVFVRGIYLTWESSTWTLAYREVTGASAAGSAVAEAQP